MFYLQTTCMYIISVTLEAYGSRAELQQVGSDMMGRLGCFCLTRYVPSSTGPCSEGERKISRNNSSGGSSGERGLWEKDGESNRMWAGRNWGGKAAQWGAYWWWGLRSSERECEDTEIWDSVFCQSIREVDEFTWVLGHDVIYGGKWKGQRWEELPKARRDEARWVQLLANLSSAVEPQPSLIAADIIGSSSVMSVSWVMTPRTGDGHIASKQKGMKRHPEAFEMQTLAVRIQYFHASSPIGGQNDRWLTHSAPLSAKRPEPAWAQAAPHTAPRLRTCEYLMFVVNGLQSRFCCYEQSDK